MRNSLGAVATVTLTVVGLDLLWLGVLAQPLYHRALGSLLRPHVYWPAAVGFYLFYGSAIWWAAVRLAPSPRAAARSGAGLGAFGYGVYELTNWAVLDGWPGWIVPLDWAWGILMTAGAAYLGAQAQSRSRS